MPGFRRVYLFRPTPISGEVLSQDAAAHWPRPLFSQVTCLVLYYLTVSFDNWHSVLFYALAWAEWPLMLFGVPWIAKARHLKLS